MALYNSEAVSGFPTGNLSLQLLSKISPEQIRFVSITSSSSDDLDIECLADAVRQTGSSDRGGERGSLLGRGCDKIQFHSSNQA